MKTIEQTTLRIAVVGYLLGFVAIGWAADEESSNTDSFETCLEELKKATSKSADDENGNDYDPELSLEESIRIYDECLSREGITLSIHGTLGEGAGAGTSAGSSVSEPSTNDSGAGAQTEMNGESEAVPSDGGGPSNDLETSIHEFDEMLSKIQEDIGTDRSKQVAQSAEGTTEVGQTTQETTTEHQDGTEETLASESEGSLLNPSAEVSAEAKHEDKEKRVPLDPKDEDIVLKTIREAAELETDPTTRQALWDQYYDYADKN
ncbi:MAG: hypothetical protein F4Z01_07045 [Gammaproteobacteria bacterium]|nr:hypothetical protein [Gammaproteobacteria bacterium]MYF38055.1 hypothetical protein [Gammaproteobacteria bacterium]